MFKGIMLNALPKIAQLKNIWKEINKAMEWIQWLTLLFYLVVALFFIISILFSL